MTNPPHNEVIPWEVDVHAVKQLLDTGAPFLFIDCREPDEYEFCRLPGAQLLPIKKFSEWLPSIEQHRQDLIIIHCHTGRRSLNLAKSLREVGFPNAQSMKGGIQAWSDEIDPKVPIY